MSIKWGGRGFGHSSRWGQSASSLSPSLFLDFTNTETLDSRVSFTRTTTATRTNSSGLIESVDINVPRFDYDPVTLEAKGFLIEEQRTNSIRNNTMVGAVVGTPGTLPTNWVVFSNAGLTTSVVGKGSQSGINYVDLRISGTSTTSLYVMSFDTTATSGAAGQAWTESFWCGRVGGSATNISSAAVNLRQVGGAGNNFDTAFTLSTNFNRSTSSGTLTTGATGVFAAIILNIINGAAIDITLRIGMPQLEQGEFATSVIPTTTAAATRAADVAVMTGTNFSSWYNQSEGTLFVQGVIPFVGGSSFPSFASVDDGTSNEAIEWSMWDASSDSVRFVVWDGGVNQASIATGTYAANTPLNLAGAYKVNDFAASYNGANAVTDTAGTLPTVTLLRIGQNRAAGNPLNGHIKKIAYYPIRLANAQLQAITT
jgi:hypothetical protein